MPLSKPFTIDTRGGSLDVLNAGTTLTLTSPLSGVGMLHKSGLGTLALGNPANRYASGIAIDAGRIDASDDAQLGDADVTINAAGRLRYTESAATHRTFQLNGGALEAPGGVLVTLDGASVNGGFGILRGAGSFAITGGTSLNGVATITSTTVNQTGPASATNFTNGGSFTIEAGQTLAWNVGTNTSSGRLAVNGTTSVNDFVSNGQITIPNGGMLSNSGSDLVFGGGSRTYIGSVASPGGVLDLGGQALELNGGLLVNNGTVSGVVNVNYGSMAKGSGQYGVVNIHDGGIFAPGNSPGVATAASVSFDSEPTASGGPALMIELAGTAPGMQYDQLHVTGQLSLGGALDVLLVDGFAPIVGPDFRHPGLGQPRRDVLHAESARDLVRIDLGHFAALFGGPFEGDKRNLLGRRLRRRRRRGRDGSGPVENRLRPGRRRGSYTGRRQCRWPSGWRRFPHLAAAIRLLPTGSLRQCLRPRAVDYGACHRGDGRYSPRGGRMRHQLVSA